MTVCRCFMMRKATVSRPIGIMVFATSNSSSIQRVADYRRYWRGVIYIIWRPQQWFSVGRVYVFFIHFSSLLRTFEWHSSLILDGFILDSNQWDCVPLDQFFSGDRFPNIKKEQLKRAGYWGYLSPPTILTNLIEIIAITISTTKASATELR